MPRAQSEGEIFARCSECFVTRRAAVCSEIGLDDDVVVRPGEFFDRTCEIGNRGTVLAHRAVVRSHHAEVVMSEVAMTTVRCE